MAAFLSTTIFRRLDGRREQANGDYFRAATVLKALDVGNNLLSVHSVQISNMGVAIVKRRGIAMSCVATELMTNITCLRMAVDETLSAVSQ